MEIFLNLKCEVIFNINIIKIQIIHVATDFSVNHIKKYGWILRKDWIHNELLKW